MKKLLFILKLCLLLFSQHVFAGNILTTRGNVPEEKIKIGDSVIVGNTVNLVEAIREMDKAFYDEQNQSFDFYLVNGIKFFKDQSIYANGCVVHVWELKIGDNIYFKNTAIKVLTIKKVSGNRWFKFSVSGNHFYIQDGILVHNAARFWNKQNASANWNATAPTNWGSSSGTADGASVPGASDDVTFDGAGAGGNTASTQNVGVTILSLTFTTGYTQTLTLGTGGTLSVAGNFTDRTNHTWGSSTGALQISATSTITSNGATFPRPVTFANTNTKTLSGDWTISNTLTTANTCTINSGTLTVSGLAVSGTTLGTTVIALTGTWTGASTLQLSNSLTLSGTCTISGNVCYGGGGTLTNSSSTTTTTGSTLFLSSSATYNTSGITFNNVTVQTATQTLTINSLFSVTGTLTLSSGINVTFGGTAGFTVGTLQVNSTSTSSHTFTAGNTYTITTSFQGFSDPGNSRWIFTSSHATNTVSIILSLGAVCSVSGDFIRVDATGGRTINTFHGALTTTTNIFSYTDYGGGVSGSYLYVQ